MSTSGVGRGAVLVVAGVVIAACSSPPQPVPVTAAESPGQPAGVEGASGSDDMAADMGIADPPEVAVVRRVTPQESQEVLRGCLRDAGWPQAADGGIEVPVGQEEALDLALYVCYQQYPVKEKYAQPLTAAQLGVLYDWWVQHTVPCFEQRGWEVGEIPTREVFLANPVWLPAEPIAEQAGAEVQAGLIETMDEALYGVCPGPPDEVLYP